MKTHVKLLVLAMVLVMFAFCLAACGGGNGDTSTTTTTAPTTTAPVTTTAPPDTIELDVLVDENVTYTGAELRVVDVEKPVAVDVVSTTYKKLDANGNMIGDLGEDMPIDCGIYEVTVTFGWRDTTKADPIPAPISKIFTVVPASLETASKDKEGNDVFGAKGTEILFKTVGMDFDPLDSVTYGKLPGGIVPVASIEKLADKNATSGVAIGSKITSDNGAGYYKVTIKYVEETGKDNFTDENQVSHSAVVYARAINKTIPYVTDFQLDNDLTKYGDPLFETEYQAGTYSGPDATALVNGYEKAAALEIWAPPTLLAANPNAKEDAATAKFYAAWDGQYIYVAVAVTDKTHMDRSDNYNNQPNPWVGDGFEFYYFFGGDAIPDVSKTPQICPTYKAVCRASTTGDGGLTATDTQKSVLFDDIQCKTTGRKDTETDTYIIEFKFPAQNESRTALATGDFIYLAYQINDLMGLPFKRLTDVNDPSSVDFTCTANGNSSVPNTPLSTVRFESIEEYDSYIASLPAQKYDGDTDAIEAKPGSAWRIFENDLADYIYNFGNRHTKEYLALEHEECVPMILQLGAAPVAD